MCLMLVSLPQNDKDDSFTLKGHASFNHDESHLRRTAVWDPGEQAEKFDAGFGV